MCKVSVLMPVYNAEKYLAEAVDSIINQTFPDWELVIINDGSTDSSEEILKSYTDNRIQFIENEGNLGLIKTLNKGIGLCRGEYIARMDADDISLPTRLEKQIHFLDENPEHVLLGTNANIIDQKDNPSIGKLINLSDNSLLNINLLFTNPFIHPSMMIRKSALNNCLFDPNWMHVEDYELWTRLALKGKIANLEEALLEYRWHGSNVSVQHAELQEKNKDRIVKQQLKTLHIDANQEEIDLHRLSFNLYSFGVKKERDTSKVKEISQWFQFLIRQNKIVKAYNEKDMEAFLWSRWMVLCIYKGEYLKAIFPKFASYSPSIIVRMINLVRNLSKK